MEVIEIENNGYQIRPNPVTDFAKIYFDNNDKHQHQLFIYNLNGILLFSSTTQVAFFEVNFENFHSGIYLFKICTQTNLQKATGKLVIQ